VFSYTHYSVIIQ